MTTIEDMNETMIRDLTVRLANERQMSIADALSIVYNSRIFLCLNTPKTGLYYQSPNYVYWYLEQELNKKNSGILS